MLEADAGHVAEQGAGGGHHAQADKGVGNIVVAHTAGVEIAGLLPEAVDIGAGGLPLGQALRSRHRALASVVVRKQLLAFA